ncbi:DNA sulfur modification protein DndD [Caenimonas terrae]|uniref:DNA sulfur modification protein DndD n=1 Tax=Caenimonas terrae TaxID=696074 RepID=A0ABW0N6I5_9BURK
MAKVTFSHIAISNLGPFRDRQVLNLAVGSGKPIVLVRALNGSGKTTLLTCIQVALYGSRAFSASRAGEYEQLISGLHRADATGPAEVELGIRVEIEGVAEELTLVRTWEARGRTSERFEILRDKSPDFELASEWEDFIDSILPAELAQLFLFDGERIESLASPRTLPDMLRRATEAFLGIGGIEALGKDLIAVERRSMLRSREQMSKYAEAKDELELLDGQHVQALQRVCTARDELARARTELDVAQINFRRFSQKAKRSGLDAYQNAAALQANVDAADAAVKEALAAVRESLADPYVPFAKLGELWKTYTAQWEQERETAVAEHVSREMVRRDERVLASMKDVLPSKAMAHLRGVLDEEGEKYRVLGALPRLLCSKSDPRTLKLRVEQAAASHQAAVEELALARTKLQKAQKRVSAVPEEDRLRDILSQMQQESKALAKAESEVNRLEKEHGECDAILKRLDLRLEASRERLGKQFRGQALEERAIAGSQRARVVLSQFKENLLAAKAEWLSDMITAEFKALMRKQRLFSRVSVHPLTYQVTITGTQGRELPMERLSAGERQLLAIAVLSALIRERKGMFPVVVDTPLARLDKQHRKSLVQRFFSRISHQVIVLSTDEEVDEELLADMRRHMTGAYTLSYSDEQHSSQARVMEELAA